MNPSDLRSRLDAIKKRDKTSAKEKSSGQGNTLPGRNNLSDQGNNLSCQISEADKRSEDQKKQIEKIHESEKSLLANGWIKVSEMVFEKTTYSENPLPGYISDFLIPEKKESSNFVFYDTETTGLSGGAGNLVFLIGFGFIEKRKFKTVQLLLSDFPGEPAFIETLNHYISPDRIYVSYNGKSFDANLIKTRFAMNGMKTDFGYQLDLLYPSRRLWKDIIGSCSLGDIEREILLKRRALDVPGAMVPDLYFDFLRTGKYSFIEGVSAHHLEDIISLAQLLAVFEKIFKEPLSFKKSDMSGLSSLLMSRHTDAAVSVLQKGMEEGSYQCAKELGLYYKRISDFKAASLIWKGMWEKNKSIFAGIELAKFYEHREKDIEKALDITEIMLSFERIRIRKFIQELDRRKARLEGKAVKEKNLKNI